MYRVVGCSDCAALWVIGGRPDTSECPRCGRRRPLDRRRTFFRSDAADEAREARSRLLAERGDAADEFDAVDSFGELEEELTDAGPDDETYLAESGVDPEAVSEAGERANTPRQSRSREATVRAALRELSAPDAAAVRRYCADHGVPAEAAETLLEKLVRAGEATEQDGTYRLL